MGSECSTDKCSKKKQKKPEPSAPQPLAERPAAVGNPGDKQRSWVTDKVAYDAQTRLQVTEQRSETHSTKIGKREDAQKKDPLPVDSNELATFRVDVDEMIHDEGPPLPPDCHESSDEDPPPLPNLPRDADPRSNLLPRFNEVAR